MSIVAARTTPSLVIGTTALQRSPCAV